MGKLRLLYTMIVIFLAACGQEPATYQQHLLLQAVDSNHVCLLHIQQSAVRKLDDNLHLPYYYLTPAWQPKGDSLISLTKDIVTYLDSLYKEMNVHRQRSEDKDPLLLASLYDRIATYKTCLLKVLETSPWKDNPRRDSMMRQDASLFYRMPLLWPVLDTMEGSAQFPETGWANMDMAHSGTHVLPAMVKKVEQEVLMLSSSVMDYLSVQCHSYICGYTNYKPYAILSSSTVSAGQSLDLICFVGEFPYMDGSRIKLNDSCLWSHNLSSWVNYTFKAPSTPGTYQVPFTFDIREWGMQKETTRYISYTVTE